jgi:3-deoxy-D-manno-octulosonate 8-phosphate phosphatase (KDO 8-P phosphatase)
VTSDPALLERARRIRLLVLDVDGVLTDGRLHITAHGEETKVFHVRDGSGIVAVQRAGIVVAIISGAAPPSWASITCARASATSAPRSMRCSASCS